MKFSSHIHKKNSELGRPASAVDQEFQKIRGFSNPIRGKKRLLDTTTTLLEGLNQSDDYAWSRFDEFYRPLLRNFALRANIPPADAEDIAQEVMLEFRRLFRDTYDRERGRLRRWVMGIARYKVLEQRKRVARRKEINGQTIDFPGPDDWRRIEDEEWQQAVAAAALNLLRNKRKCRLAASKIDAFEQFALLQQPAADVAVNLEMSVDDVFRSKYLCLRYLKSCRNALDRFFDG